MSEQPANHEVLKERPVIVVDIDGVIFDTPTQAVRKWNAAHGTEYSTADIYDHHAVHDKAKFRNYHDDGKYADDRGRFDDGFYDAQTDVEGYVLLPGAKEMLWRLKREFGAEIKALTARNPDNLRGVTERALSEHVGLGYDDEHLIDELHFSGDPDFGGAKEKGEILVELSADAMVEDAVKNAVSSEKFGISAVVLAQDYNEKGHEWPPEKRAVDWNHVYELIVTILEAKGYKRVLANA